MLLLHCISPEVALRVILHRHDFGRKRGIAEVDGQPSIEQGDARDPTRTSCALPIDFPPVFNELPLPIIGLRRYDPGGPLGREIRSALPRWGVNLWQDLTHPISA